MADTEVNPTAQYLVDQFREALAVGQPLASGAMQEVIWQVRCYGAATLAIGLIEAVVAVACLRAVQKALVAVKGDNLTAIQFATTIGCGGGAMVFSIAGANDVTAGLRAMAAPLVWLGTRLADGL